MHLLLFPMSMVLRLPPRLVIVCHWHVIMGRIRSSYSSPFMWTLYVLHGAMTTVVCLPNVSGIFLVTEIRYAGKVTWWAKGLFFSKFQVIAHHVGAVTASRE